MALLSPTSGGQPTAIPAGHFVDAETAAVDYVNGGDGLLMAPTYAVPRLLARNGLSFTGLRFHEIHEAFASVVLCHPQAWSPRSTKGAPGPGRGGGRSTAEAERQRFLAGRRPPFAATGGRIVAQLAKQLAQKREPRRLSRCGV